MTLEHKRYSTLEEYEKGLRETTLSEVEIQLFIEHERAHFEEAEKLGYVPVYALTRFYESGSNLATLLLACVTFQGRNPSPEHMIHILLAPKVPSDSDLYDALRLRKEINWFKRGNLG